LQPTALNHIRLIEAITALNQNRILSRIRSRHAIRWRAKSPVSLLQRLNTAKQLLQNSAIDPVRFRALSRKLDHIQEDLDHLESMEHPGIDPSGLKERILALVNGFHGLFEGHEQDLQRIPDTPGIWPGNATEALIDRLRKTNQYINACEELLRAARKYDVFSNVIVDFIDLQLCGRRLNPACSVDEAI